MLDHRLSPYEIPCDMYDPQAGRYFDDPRVTSYIIPWVEDESTAQGARGLLSPAWLAGERLLFTSSTSPPPRSNMTSSRRPRPKSRKIDPKLKIVSPFFKKPRLPSRQDRLPGPRRRDQYLVPRDPLLRPRRDGPPAKKAGGEAWWYVCCQPLKPYTNLMGRLGRPPATVCSSGSRKKYHVTGFLYWMANWWGPRQGHA